MASPFSFGTANSTIASQGVPEFTGVSFTTSAQALPIPIMWGTRRIAPQVIWQSDLGGPGVAGLSGQQRILVDGPDVGGTGYNYTGSALPSHLTPGLSISAGGAFTASVQIKGGALDGQSYKSGDTSSSDSVWWRPTIFALCEGPINSINRAWNDGGAAPIPFVFPPPSTTVGGVFGTAIATPMLFYTMFVGDGAQTAWLYFAAVNAQAGGPYYTGNQDLAYRQTAYLASALVDTGHNNTMPQQSFEVVRTPIMADRHFDSYGLGYDYPLSDIIVDFLTNPDYGMGFQSTDIDSASLTTYMQYLFAQGLFHSPLLDSQTAATDIIDQWAIESNTWIYNSGTEIRFEVLK